MEQRLARADHLGHRDRLVKRDVGPGGHDPRVVAGRPQHLDRAPVRRGRRNPAERRAQDHARSLEDVGRHLVRVERLGQGGVGPALLDEHEQLAIALEGRVQPLAGSAAVGVREDGCAV